MRDQTLCEVGIDAPVSPGAGIGQGGALDRLPAAHVIELARLRGETDLDVAKALPIGQLGKRHDPIVLSTRQRLDVSVALVAIDDMREGCPGQEVHQLCEQGFAGVHDGDLRGRYRKNGRNRRSSRHHPETLATY